MTTSLDVCSLNVGAVDELRLADNPLRDDLVLVLAVSASAEQALQVLDLRKTKLTDRGMPDALLVVLRCLKLRGQLLSGSP